MLTLVPKGVAKSVHAYTKTAPTVETAVSDSEAEIDTKSHHCKWPSKWLRSAYMKDLKGYCSSRYRTV